jgi:hypothetical protein
VLGPRQHRVERGADRRRRGRARQRLVDQPAPRELIAGRAGPRAGEQLGRQVAAGARDARAHRAAGVDRARQAEVDDDGAPVGPDQDVLGLDVAVHEAGGVDGAEPTRDVDADRQARGGGARRGRQPAPQVVALDQRHRHEHLALEIAGVEHGDDARMVDASQRARLGQRRGAEPAWIAAVPGELERHVALQHGVGGAQDDAHRAAGQRAADAVTAELGWRARRAVVGGEGVADEGPAALAVERVGQCRQAQRRRQCAVAPGGEVIVGEAGHGARRPRPCAPPG